MTKQTFVLDPNAASYTDNQIVDKINNASTNITRSNAVGSVAVDLSGKTTDNLSQGSTNKYDTGAPPATLEDLSDGSTRKAMSSTEKTKLSGIESNATADQTGAEVRDLIVALSDADRKIVITEPTTGKYKVVSVQRDSTGKLEVSYDDVAV